MSNAQPFVHRHPEHSDHLVHYPPAGPGGPPLRTLYEVAQYAWSAYARRPMLGTRKPLGANAFGPYEWLTYEQVSERANQFASGLIELGIKPRSCFGCVPRIERG